MKEKKTILISPLDWGLGHTTRLIPIINYLKDDNNIILAASGISYEYYKSYYPKIKLIRINGYNVKYANKYSILKLALQIPKILIAIYKEHKLLKKIIYKYGINSVISDNRYGLWNKKIKSIFITHQINIKTKSNNLFLEKIIYKINLLFINKFDYCLIPDLKDSKLSGELTSKFKLPRNAKFIGLLSRFANKQVDLNTNMPHYDIFVILSGPEPQKTNFQELIINQLKKTSYKVLIANGLSKKYNNKTNNINIESNLSDIEMAYYIKTCKYIISRTGYTTIMDLFALQRSAILVPTPKQTEQEYLSELHKNIFLVIKQKNFNFKKLESEYVKYNSDNKLLDKEVFKEHIKEYL